MKLKNILLELLILCSPSLFLSASILEPKNGSSDFNSRHGIRLTISSLEDISILDDDRLESTAIISSKKFEKSKLHASETQQLKSFKKKKNTTYKGSFLKEYKRVLDLNCLQNKKFVILMKTSMVLTGLGILATEFFLMRFSIKYGKDRSYTNVMIGAIDLGILGIPAALTLFLCALKPSLFRCCKHKY